MLSSFYSCALTHVNWALCLHCIDMNTSSASFVHQSNMKYIIIKKVILMEIKIYAIYYLCEFDYITHAHCSYVEVFHPLIHVLPFIVQDKPGQTWAILRGTYKGGKQFLEDMILWPFSYTFLQSTLLDWDQDHALLIRLTWGKGLGPFYVE